MASSLSNLATHLSVGIPRIKCKYGHNDKKCDMMIKYCDCFLEYVNFKANLIETKC